MHDTLVMVEIMTVFKDSLNLFTSKAYCRPVTHEKMLTVSYSSYKVLINHVRVCTKDAKRLTLHI